MRIKQEHNCYTKISYSESEINICLYSINHNILGVIDLSKKKNFWVTHSNPGIKEEFRGKGIGLYMYKRLIRYGLKKGLDIRSSMYTNQHSKYIWKKLKNYFYIKYKNGRYCVLGSLDKKF